MKFARFAEFTRKILLNDDVANFSFNRGWKERFDLISFISLRKIGKTFFCWRLREKVTFQDAFLCSKNCWKIEGNSCRSWKRFCCKVFQSERKQKNSQASSFKHLTCFIFPKTSVLSFPDETWFIADKNCFAQQRDSVRNHFFFSSRVWHFKRW